MTVGKLICLEGPEGAGKTTILGRLKESLDGSCFAFFREPGGTAFGEQLRAVIMDHPNVSPETQMLLFMASRLHIFTTEIRPRLEQGIHVVTDRMDASTFAYQVFGNPAALEVIFGELRRFYLSPLGDGDWLKPTYIFLDILPEVGLARAKDRPGNSYDEKPLEYHQRVYQGYQHFVLQHRHVRIDASKPSDEVFHEVLGAIMQITA